MDEAEKKAREIFQYRVMTDWGNEDPTGKRREIFIGHLIEDMAQALRKPPVNYKDYEELRKLPRHASLMKWDKSDLACHSIKYQSLCGRLTQELEALRKQLEALKP